MSKPPTSSAAARIANNLDAAADSIQAKLEGPLRKLQKADKDKLRAQRNSLRGQAVVISSLGVGLLLQEVEATRTALVTVTQDGKDTIAAIKQVQAIINIAASLIAVAATAAAAIAAPGGGTIGALIAAAQAAIKAAEPLLEDAADA